MADRAGRKPRFIVSKTDKTRPWDVKKMEHPVEHHDHRNGVCDLTIPGYSGHRGGWADGKCYIDAAWWRPEFRCACNMCDGTDWGYGPRQLARKSRYKARREAKNYNPEDY